MEYSFETDRHKGSIEFAVDEHAQEWANVVAYHYGSCEIRRKAALLFSNKEEEPDDLPSWKYTGSESYSCRCYDGFYPGYPLPNVDVGKSPITQIIKATECEGVSWRPSEGLCVSSEDCADFQVGYCIDETSVLEGCEYPGEPWSIDSAYNGTISEALESVPDNWGYDEENVLYVHHYIGAIIIEAAKDPRWWDNDYLYNGDGFRSYRRDVQEQAMRSRSVYRCCSSYGERTSLASYMSGLDKEFFWLEEN